MKLSVIIPVYNEAATCLQLIQKVQAIPLDKEIIVVNDGSTDSTSELLSQVEGITLLSHTINQGKGAAVQTAAEHIKGDIVILQDGDLEYNPEDYYTLVEPIQNEKADIVFGSRWLGKKNKWSFHYMGNKLITLFSNIINQRWVNDMASCYKAIPADIFRSLELKSNGFGLEAEITAKVFRKRFKLKEIPISYERRTSVQGKKLRLKDGLVSAWACLRYRFFD
ncbi:MAG: glycosyltransferase family 2 protein [Candidatus Marinimicrobia bacterium]|jgi:glycosyltransferase involved in cell wall biosynthesis|nr:glycosyltransferase family 2 protein [Candidatus Neomarinimicrobiota bacterium]MDP6727209.1 glycosyltransferase family 2 protein [Candidatus Neomarinimicrobiota bacterium]|tara:strand:- start:53 stop:721 length:669 start_codon:yes stop_codon:yes gene_type:complete